MAVIESKGNGFSLYNGVKRLSSPEYDEVAYPYALFCTNSAGVSFFRAAAKPFVYDGSTNVQIIGTAAIQYRALAGATEWTFLAEGETDISINISKLSLDWSNHDIINTTDNSVYFAASEPISLDGMNVIEWDGDTEGLEVFSGDSKYLFVSNATDVDTSKEWIGLDAFRSGAGTLVRRALPTEKDGYWRLAYTASYVPTTGVYIYSTNTRYCPLFAYYPVAEPEQPEEPEEPEQPEIDRGTLFLLYRIFSQNVFYAITGKKHWTE